MAYNLTLLQPEIKYFGTVRIQKFFDLFLDFQNIRIGRLLQIGKLIRVQCLDDPVNIALQFLIIDTVQFGKLTLDQAFAVRHAHIRRLLIKPFLEESTVCAGQLPCLWRSFFGIIHIYTGHFRIKCSKVNLNVFVFQGESVA